MCPDEFAEHICIKMQVLDEILYFSSKNANKSSLKNPYNSIQV